MVRWGWSGPVTSARRMSLVIKGSAVRRGAHLGLYSLDQLGEIVETVQLLPEGEKSLTLSFRTGFIRNNGNTRADVWGPTQDEPGWETSAEVALDWERNTRNCLQDGTLAGRLVTAHDDLRQGDVVVDALQTELINRVRKCGLVLGAELAQGAL